MPISRRYCDSPTLGRLGPVSPFRSSSAQDRHTLKVIVSRPRADTAIDLIHAHQKPSLHHTVLYCTVRDIKLGPSQGEVAERRCHAGSKHRNSMVINASYGNNTYYTRGKIDDK